MTNIMPDIATIRRGGWFDQPNDPAKVRSARWWTVNFAGGQELRVTTPQLLSNKKFRRCVMDKFGRCFAQVESAEWFAIVDAAMQKGREVERSPTSHSGCEPGTKKQGE